MTKVQMLQEELDECIQLAGRPDVSGEQRRKALWRAQAITRERMTITTELAYAGAEAELQQMILEGPKM